VIRNRPVSLSLVALFLWLNGCTYTQIRRGDVADHGKVRVTTVYEGETVRTLVHEPRIEADTLRGDYQGHSVAIPLSRVSALEVGEADGVTALKVAGGIVALAALTALVVCAESDCLDLENVGY
jgi:hypothetical protein